MNRIASLLLLVSPLFVIAGCEGQASGPPTNVEQQNQATSKADLKTRLQEIAKTGVAGSGTAGMSAGIESLRAENSALADDLLAALKKLESAKSPAEVTKLANEMAGKL